MNILPNHWTTERLAISDLTEEEILQAQHIFESSSYINQWDGHEYDPNYVMKCFTEGNVPPGGNKENFKIQTIKTTENNNLIGLLNVYHGYPIDDSLYIEFCCIDKNIQKQGYGQELIHQLSEEAITIGCKEIRANVAIKNWPAIRFWIKSGFNKISGLYGDHAFSENAFADIELIKTL